MNKVKVNVKEILKYCKAATPGPWDYKFRYIQAKVNDSSNKDWAVPRDILVGKCSCCDSEYVSTIADAKGNYHIHRYPSEDWREVYSDTGELIIGNYDYEQGGVASKKADAEFMARARTDLPNLCERVIDLEVALSRLLWCLQDSNDCWQVKENAKQVLEIVNG